MKSNDEVRIVCNSDEISINGITIAIGNFGFRKTNTTKYLSEDIKFSRVL